MYSMVIRQSYIWCSVPPNISSTHLAPNTVIVILLTVFSILYINVLIVTVLK